MTTLSDCSALATRAATVFTASWIGGPYRSVIASAKASAEACGMIQPRQYAVASGSSLSAVTTMTVVSPSRAMAATSCALLAGSAATSGGAGNGGTRRLRSGHLAGLDGCGLVAVAASAAGQEPGDHCRASDRAREQWTLAGGWLAQVARWLPHVQVDT